MTRTARKKAKKEPLSATSWEELKQPLSDQNKVEGGADDVDTHKRVRKVRKVELKVTQKEKLGLCLSEKVKKKLESVTGKKLKRSLSDTVGLLEPCQSDSGSAHEEPGNVKSPKKLKSQNRDKTRRKSGSEKKEQEEDASEEGGRERRLAEGVKKRKRKIVSEDRVPLLHSSSDSSLSDEVGDWEVPGESDSGEGGSGDGDGGREEVAGDGKCEAENGIDVETATTNGKSEAKKKTSTRVKVGKRWVKAGGSGPEQPAVVGNGGREGEKEGWGSGRRGRRTVDDERRKKRIEHRKLRRQRKKVCFNCRQPGHWVGECPLTNSTAAGVCFKCGSSEHACHQCHVKVSSGDFPFAKCFICGEVGHLSRSCPDNPRGLYPRGGGCRVCGSVEHLRANCPVKQQSSNTDTAHGSDSVSCIAASTADAQDFTTDAQPARNSKRLKTSKRTEKVVRF